MIICKCKRECQDRLTNEMYAEGKEYNFTNERAVEVCKTPYFEKVKEVVEEAKEETLIEEVKEEMPKVETHKVTKKTTKKKGE